VEKNKLACMALMIRSRHSAHPYGVDKTHSFKAQARHLDAANESDLGALLAATT